MTDAPSRGERRAEDLGGQVLAAMLCRTRAAVLVLDGHRRVVYGNPAACLLLGRPLARLRGRDLLERVPADEHAPLQARLDPRSVDPGVAFTAVVRGAGDAEQDVVGSAVVVRDAGAPLVSVTLWDRSGPHSAELAGAALAQTAALVGAASTEVTLTRIARFAVEGTRACACTVVVAGDDDRFTDRGAHSRGPRLRGLDWRAGGPGWAAVVDRPAGRWVGAMTGGAVLVGGTAGRRVVLPEARTLWAADPVTRDHAAAITELPYQTGVGIPLTWRSRTIGLCTLYLPPEVGVLTESELALVTTLADHAALAVVNARLTARAAEAAALEERARLARDLHDSVSQALFSMTMHARAARLAMDKAGVEPDGPLARSLAEVSDLTRGALAEMRALIFELRPDALADEGLVVALRKQAAVLSARHGFAVTVEGPGPRIALDDGIEQQLYRIAVEALHNVARHAGAAEVLVRVEPGAGTVRLTVTDDGTGFDPQVPRPGHLGLVTMAERAAAVGARFSLTSTPGAGTTVAVESPVQADGPLPGC